jgi:hypothetical protein
MDKLVLVDTHANPDAQQDNLVPDISVYTADNVPDNNTKTSFSKMELFVELKLAKTSDPLRDQLQPQAEKFHFENDSDVPQLNCGQLCSYAVARVGSQFRVYIEQLHILVHFFWCYAHLNLSHQGYNISISPALLEDLQQIQHVEKCL